MLLAGWLETLSHRFSSPLRSLNQGTRRRKSARLFRPVAADILEDRTVLSSVDFALASGKTPKAALQADFNPTTVLTDAPALVRIQYETLRLATVQNPASGQVRDVRALTLTEDSTRLGQSARVAFIGVDEIPTRTGETVPALTNGSQPINGQVAIVGLRGTFFDPSVGSDPNFTPLTKGGNIVGVIINGSSNRTIADMVRVNLGVNSSDRLDPTYPDPDRPNSKTSPFATVFDRSKSGTGNKMVVFSHLTFAAGLEVVTGNGKDLIAFEDVDIKGSLPASPVVVQPHKLLVDGNSTVSTGGTLAIATGNEGTGEGDLIFFTGGVQTQFDLRLNTEDGDDQVHFDALKNFRDLSDLTFESLFQLTSSNTVPKDRTFVGEDLLMDLGRGDDLLVSNGLFVRDVSLISGSVGNDIIDLENSLFLNTAQIVAGAGDDSFFVFNSAFGGSVAEKLFLQAAFRNDNLTNNAGLILSGETGNDSFFASRLTLRENQFFDARLPFDSAFGVVAYSGGFGTDQLDYGSGYSAQLIFDIGGTRPEGQLETLRIDQLPATFFQAGAGGRTNTRLALADSLITKARALFNSILVPKSVGDADATTNEDVVGDRSAANGLLSNDFASVVGEALAGTTVGGLQSDLTRPAAQVTVTVNPDGSFSFAPAQDVNNNFQSTDWAVRNFRYLVNNGLRYGNLPTDVTLSLTPVNDPPVGVVTAPPSVLEDAGSVTTPTVLDQVFGARSTALDEQGQTVTRTITNFTNSGMFSSPPVLNGNGTLSYVLNPNANGSSTVTIQLQDDGGTANGGQNTTTLQTIDIVVTSVNDAPEGTDGAQTILEGATLTLTAAMFGFTDPNDTPANALARVQVTTLPALGTLTLNSVPVVAGDFVTVAQLAANQLVFTPANADDNGAAYATFTFQVEDDGGTANGGVNLDPTANTLTINITPVNDAPAGTDSTQTILEGATLTFTAAMFGFTDPNDTPANALARVRITTLPATGTLALNAVPVVAGDFVTVAQLAANQLVFTPANANDNGAAYASFTFQVEDDGGTANGGVNLDPTANTLTIDITAVNDAPQFTFALPSLAYITPGADQPVTEVAFAIGIQPGPANESGQTLTFTVTNDNNAMFTVQPDIDEVTGNLTFTLAGGASGLASVTVTLTDNGGTANGGVNFLTRVFTIGVTP